VGKIGIFLPGQHGDMIQATSVLKYKDVLWPGKDIVWFCGSAHRDVLKHNDAISEVRWWPCGWGLGNDKCVFENIDAAAKGKPLWGDFIVLRNPSNHLEQSRKHEFEQTKDLDEGYFPAPWMMVPGFRGDLDYPNCSRKVCGADFSWEWHPYLGFSDEERKMVEEFCLRLPHKKTIMLETESGSFKTFLDDDLIRETIAICRRKLGSCNFIFASAGDNSRFFDDAGVVSCSQFTVRQTALVNNHSDLFIGHSSGISQAVNCWGNKPTPKLQYCGSFLMSSASIANGPFELVITSPRGSDTKEHELRFPSVSDHRQEYKSRLASVLDKL
jgi:hypothetical protein